jgi:hypothetical protein
MLFHRQALAGHGGLVDEQVLGGQHPRIGRHHVAGRQGHHVAGHQPGHRPSRGAWPGRSTLAWLLTMALSASAAWLLRRSCTKRMPVARATMARMTVAERRSCVSQDTPARAVSSRLKGLR